jgi:hypothetical protein
MTNIYIDKWSIGAIGTSYTAPESIRSVLQGKVYGHPNFENGSEVFTSRILDIQLAEGIVRTVNTVYKLLEPDKKWIDWLRNKGVLQKYFPNYEN